MLVVQDERKRKGVLEVRVGLEMGAGAIKNEEDAFQALWLPQFV